MGGVSIYSRNTNFEDAEGAIQPIGGWSDAGLEGCFLLTGSLPRAIRNRANFKPDAYVVGSPGIGANYLTMTSGSNFLQTFIGDAPEVSILAAARFPASEPSAGVIASTFVGASSAHSPTASFGTHLKVISNTAFAGVGGYWTGSAASAVEADGAVAAGGGWSFVSTRLGTGGVHVDNLTAGNVWFTASALARDPSVNTFRIGSDYAASEVGTVDLAFLMIFSRQVNDAEQAAIYAQAKAYLASKSITI